MSGHKAVRRRLRFHARITTEREILTIVNSSDACRDVPLAGMTAYAIADWEIRAKAKLEEGRASKAADFLLEIGRRTELLADDSRDVFGGRDLGPNDDLERAKMALLEILSNRRGERNQ